MTGAGPPTELLLLAADEPGARWIRSLVEESLELWALRREASVAAAADALATGGFELFLVDLAGQPAGEREHLARLLADRATPATVVVSADGAAGPDLETARGAQDLLPRQGLDASGLSRALRYARERYRLVRAVADERNRRFRVFDAASAAILQLDSGGRPVLASQGAEELLGGSIADLSRLPWLESVAPQPAHPLPLRLRESARTRRAASFECDVFPATGQSRRVAWRTRPLGERARAGLLVVGLDVTPTRELRRQLRHAETLSVLGQLLSGVSDGIAAETALMRDGLARTGDVPPEHRRLADRVDEQLRRLDRLARLLASYGQPLGSPVADTDPAAPAREALEAVRGAAAERDVRLDLQVAGGADRVSADSERLAMALENVLLNAIQASPESAAVTLEVGSASDGGVEMAVCDAGPGLDRPVEDLFEPFQTTRPGASGLGLPVAQRIAVAHGGRLGVDAREGGGARVWLRLPGGRPRD